MPRRLGRFQKALVDWHAANRTRFLVPVKLRMNKPGCALIRFLNHPDYLTIMVNRVNLGAWVYQKGNAWDALLDLDVLPAQTDQGLICGLCEGEARYWPNLETLWADHLFEPFLEWVNESYAKADAVLLFGRADSFTIVKLRQPKSISGLTSINDPAAAAHLMLANAAQFDALAAIMPT